MSLRNRCSIYHSNVLEPILKIRSKNGKYYAYSYLCDWSNPAFQNLPSVLFSQNNKQIIVSISRKNENFSNNEVSQVNTECINMIIDDNENWIVSVPKQNVDIFISPNLQRYYSKKPEIVTVLLTDDDDENFTVYISPSYSNLQVQSEYYTFFFEASLENFSSQLDSQTNPGLIAGIQTNNINVNFQNSFDSENQNHFTNNAFQNYQINTETHTYYPNCCIDCNLHYINLNLHYMDYYTKKSIELNSQNLSSDNLNSQDSQSNIQTENFSYVLRAETNNTDLNFQHILQNDFQRRNLYTHILCQFCCCCPPCNYFNLSMQQNTNVVNLLLNSSCMSCYSNLYDVQAYVQDENNSILKDYYVNYQGNRSIQHNHCRFCCSFLRDYSFINSNTMGINEVMNTT